MKDYSNLPSSQKEAKELNCLHYYTDKLCQHNHISPRYTSTGTCCECVKLRAKEYGQTNKIQHNLNNKKYRAKNKDKIYRYNKEYSWKQKLLVIEKYGSKCECCGENNPEFLSIDHIDGTGHKHRKENKTQGSRIYSFLIQENFPKDNFRLLCFNCNSSLGFYGYCPHKNNRNEI